MDYSHLAHDPDHPEGSSPWNTSPQHSARPSFSGNDNLPQSPFPDSTTQPTAGAGDSRTAQDGTERGQNFGDGSLRESQDTKHSASPDMQSSAHSAMSSGGFAEGSHTAQEHGRHSTQEGPAQSRQDGSRQQTPARYQTGARAQRSAMPRHKLHAKITGLERTGRKDPILRFDVYVRRTPKGIHQHALNAW